MYKTQATTKLLMPYSTRYTAHGQNIGLTYRMHHNTLCDAAATASPFFFTKTSIAPIDFRINNFDANRYHPLKILYLYGLTAI